MGTRRRGGLHKRLPETPSLSSYRDDIAGLRALAIMMVVSMHIGLLDIHGGVDVSFVLSGFLNTLILFREIDRTGHINVRGFLARRVRRLVPGAVVVIGLTLLLVWKFTPLQFKSVATDASLAAIGGLNWRLVEEGTDYFAASSNQTPLQHYWSLGVEEQFYLLLPFVLMCMAWIGRKLFRSNRTVTVFVMAAVVGGSFYECVRLTSVNQPLAYFGSYTRVWELGAGALLALCATQLSRINHVFAAALSWAGLAVILWGGFVIADLPLPGYGVLVPVVGALMVIAGGCAAPKYGPAAVCGHWSVKIVADNSYAWYLTHWPVLLLWEPITGSAVNGWSDQLRVMAVSFLCAVLIYYPLMKRLQFSKKLVHRPHFNLASFGGVTASVAGVALAAAVWAPLNIPTATAADQAPRTVNASVVKDAIDLEELPANVQPSLGDAPKDMAYADCIVDLDIKRFKPNKDCVVGNATSKHTVVLFGDSHAWQWASAFDEVGKLQDFRVVLVTKSGCSPEVYSIQNPYFKRKYTECDLWRNSALRAIDTMNPETIVVTGRVRQETTLSGAEHAFSKLKATGAKLVYMTDAPYPGVNVPNCLAANQKNVAKCSRKVNEAIQFPEFRLLERSVAEKYGAKVIDVLPAFCAQQVCPAVIGNRVVYFDDSHMTATYARSLAPWLNKELKAALQ